MSRSSLAIVGPDGILDREIKIAEGSLPSWLTEAGFQAALESYGKDHVGLGNVDNTSDVDKPVSTEQQAALDLKAPIDSPSFTGTVSGVTKSMVGLGNVDNTSDVDKPVSSAQQTALNAKVAKGELVLNLRDQAGVIGDGITDDTVAIQAALDAAAALGACAFARGTFRTSGTVKITSDADLAGATFNYIGTGVAVQIGAGGTGVRIDRKQISAPRVIHTGKTVAGWEQVAGSVGVRIVNANTCDIYVPYVYQFETSMELRGEGQGTAYNTITLGHLSNGKYGQRFTADAGGWVNQNTFTGGRIDMLSSEGNRAAGSRFILMELTANLVNGNTWIGTSLEGNGAEYTIETHGQYNTWVGCRFEASMGAQVWWRAAATRNSILQGYGTPVPVIEAGALRNEITQAGSRRDVSVTSATGGAFNFQNDSSGTAPAWTVMDPSTPHYANEPATKYVLAATALLLKGKRPSDAFDRIQFDMNNGRLYVGPGTAALTKYFGNYGSGFAIEGGSVLWPTDNTHDLGGTVNRPRYVRAGTANVTGSFTTATRPSAVTAGAGAVIWDSTIGWPVWSDGAAWQKDPVLSSPNGTRYRITVGDDGALTTTAL